MSAWERNWKLPVGPFGLENAEFELVRHVTSPVDFYTMKIKSCGNSEDWSRCKLVSRGRFLQPWAPLPSLPAYAPEHKDLYKNQIEKWLKKVTAVTTRLEGELEKLEPPPAPQSEQQWPPLIKITIEPLAITMLIAKDATVNPAGGLRDLLIDCAVSQLFDQPIVFGGGDGTGHGNTHP
jgi:hypothetical protein